MKKKFLGVLFALPLMAQAEVVALNFDALPLVRFAQTTYREMLHRDFVMAPELLAADKPISVRVRAIDTKDLPGFVESVLSSQGVRSEIRDGVYYLTLAVPASSPSTTGGTPFNLTGPMHQDGKVASLSGFSSSSAQPAHFDPAMLEREIFRPQNRKATFVTEVLNAAFPLLRPAFAAENAVVLSAPPAEMSKVRTLAGQLDTVASNVKLSATFVEVSTNESSALGVSVVADVLGARLGIKLGDTSNGSLTLRTNSFQAVIDALSADGRFKQVAAPTAVVVDNEKSTLSFGDSVPTVASTTLDRNGNPIQQIQYQQSGVLLTVQPTILGSQRISVVIDGQVSSFSATTTGVSGSPTLSKRQVQTTVTLDDGELLLIGGLNNNRSVRNSSGFSFLPKAWSTSNNSTLNTDLVLILTAKVVK